MAKDKKKVKKSKEVEVTKKVKKSKGEKSSNKDKGSALAAARLKAKKAGGKSKSTKKPLPSWKAPEDFKPFFLELKIKTDKDGLLTNMIKATRYQGKYDTQAPDKKKAELQSYDLQTLVGVSTRLSAVLFKPSLEKIYPASIKDRNATEKVKDKEGNKKEKLVHRQAKRLPPSTQFTILLRVSKKAKDDTLSTTFKFIKQIVKKDSGVLKGIELDKKDPAYRAIRKSARILPAAFKDCKLPPKPERASKKSKKEKDDE